METRIGAFDETNVSLLRFYNSWLSFLQEERVIKIINVKKIFCKIDFEFTSFPDESPQQAIEKELFLRGLVVAILTTSFL